MRKGSQETVREDSTCHCGPWGHSEWSEHFSKISAGFKLCKIMQDLKVNSSLERACWVQWCGANASQTVALLGVDGLVPIDRT